MHTIQVYKYKLNSKQVLRLVINFSKISCWIGINGNLHNSYENGGFRKGS